jgi:pimeloyl-ACP methyl ester carboxylesterase
VLGAPGTSRGTILLISGAGVTAMAWPARFYQPLIDAGYQVIRYDNRGLGESSWIEDWSKENAYTLEDMAKDGLAVLDVPS